MSNRLLIVLILTVVSGFVQRIEGAPNKFSNPLLIKAESNCMAGNIAPDRFSAEITSAQRIEICRAIELVSQRLDSGKWSSAMEWELKEVWNVFQTRKVYFAEMPSDKPRQILALAESFPHGQQSSEYDACIYLKKGVTGNKWFYHVLLHEMRHNLDFYEIWTTGRDVPQVELERRAFHMMSMMDAETPSEIRFSKVPELWKDEWNKYDKKTIEFKRDEAIAKFLRKNPFYKDLPTAVTSTTIAATSSIDSEPDAYPTPRLVRRTKRETEKQDTSDLLSGPGSRAGQPVLKP